MDLYQELISGNSSPLQQNQNNIPSGLADFAKNFRGDPKQQVMQLIQQRGGIPQDRLNTAVQQTNQIYSQLNWRNR